MKHLRISKGSLSAMEVVAAVVSDVPQLTYRGSVGKIFLFNRLLLQADEFKDGFRSSFKSIRLICSSCGLLLVVAVVEFIDGFLFRGAAIGGVIILFVIPLFIVTMSGGILPGKSL